MALYTAKQLEGKGAPIETLLNGSTNTFTLIRPLGLKGSAYFTFESVRNSKGYYLDQPKNAEGIISSLNGVEGLLQSNYIFSVVVNEEGGSFVFTPNITIPVSGSFLRATGGMSLEIT